MKSKCSFILKTSVALLLAILMVLGSVSTVIAAVVDVSTGDQPISTAAKKGLDIAGTAANADLAKTGATTKVYFRNNGNWSNVYILTSSSITFGNVWADPGHVGENIYGTGLTAANEMTLVPGETNVYQADITLTDNKVVFVSSKSDQGGYLNNCGNCVARNDYAAGKIVNAWSNNNDKMEYRNSTQYWKSGLEDYTAPVASTTRVYVKTGLKNKGNTTMTNAYIWSNTSDTWDTGAWPGQAISSWTTAGSYKYKDFTTYKYEKFKIILTNGDSSSTKQTDDSDEYATGKIWVFDSVDSTGSNGKAIGTEGYPISIGSVTGGTITSNKSVATAGTTVTLTLSANSGRSLTAPTVTKAGGGTVSVSGTGTTRTFTMPSDAVTVTATFPAETTYTVSVSSQDTSKGTVASSSVSAGATAVTLPTATPKFGWKFKNWTTTSSNITINNATSATAATVSATGAGTVTANWEADMSLNIYIVGRFRYKKTASSDWTYTGTNSGDWNADSTNIKMTATDTANVYKLETNASLAELSEKLSNDFQYFHIKSGSNIFYPQSTTTMTTSGTTLGTTGSNNMYFNSTSTDKPVTIYFNTSTKKIWYEIPDFYDVTVSNPATGGTVTASPARAEADTEITLTISPSTGYQLSSITAKDSSNATVTLSGTGNTRTFTMPAKNVTVTPVFEKITWSGLTAVGKYSTTAANDASYSNAMSPNPATIAATSATQLDGVAVSAPATDPTGYVFAGWYTTTGSFANAANKDTTFKPNAANAVAIAKYKKIFTITSSVDNTGTGAGTVTIAVTSGDINSATDKVLAGGTYTVTATPKNGSAIESIKITKGSTTTTYTSNQTVTNVSADQTVVVKFKSNVYLKGTINNWSEDDVMIANSAGTSYTVSNVVLEADTYQFRLYANGEWKANSVDTWELNGIATHGTSGNNLTITPSVKAKVTFVSDGTKFTSITAIPYDSTQYNVTLTQSADYTITSTYMGVEYTTSGKNANVTVPVYSGTGFTYTVTPASGKYLSAVAQSDSVALSPAFVATTHANSYTGTVSSVSKAFTVSATAANKLTIKAVTNKSARGTVSVSPTTAYPGQTVTITVTPLSGALKTLTATYGNGYIYEYKNGNWNVVTTGTSTNNAFTNVFLNPAKAAFGMAATGAAPDSAVTGASIDEAAMAAMPDIVPVGATQTIDMVMQYDSAVTINATFDPYSAESNYYYNGYDTSGNALSGYYDKQMTEGMIGGEKFSYYHVENRSGANQLFTVSLGHGGTSNGKVYFTRPGSSDWNQSNVYAYFWKEGGAEASAWPGNSMTWRWNNEYNQGVYSVDIPTGVDHVIFNDYGSHQTVNIDLTSTNGAYYWDSTSDGSGHYNVGTWSTGQDDQGLKDVGTEYFYSNTIYVDNFYSGGFNNHNIANVNNFIKPKGGNGVSWDANAQNDYYIVVLYPNTTYTITYNGHTTTNTVGNEPMVIWMKELPTDDENVTVYAKDGSIRAETFGSTYANIADTKIYLNNTVVGTDHSGNITNQTYQTYKAAKGDTIVIETTIGATDSGTLSNAAALKAKYYVRGFCINGEVSELLEPNETGVYTLTFKIPEDGDITKFEITPIYYLKDTETNPIVTYRVTGFTDELKQIGAGKPGWGDTLYTYPYYGKLGGQNNAFGAYPGQPMVYYKGQYQMQIPQKDTAWDIYESDDALGGKTGPAAATAVSGTTVSGVTMSNGYWDSVHKMIQGYGDNSASADHVQTYDYGDFYKIFNEKKPVDNIVFDFKYETTKHNFENQPAASVTRSTLDTDYGTNGNGFELLTNFHGRNVDLFGTPLSGDAADPSKTTPVYVVSIGGVKEGAGVENIAGYYATEWMVYGSSNGTDYTRITAGDKSSIPPEVLVLNDDDDTSFNTTTYPSADANHKITDWKALYTALEAYRGKPVMISYEAADAQQGQGQYYTGTGGATRNDGRWLYSKNGENITSTIKIQYSDDNGGTYTDLNTTTPQVAGLSAYFTNDGVEGEMTYSTTINPDKTFDFEAKTTNGNYKFVGWYMADGTKITSDNVAHTERSGSYTFVAKFMQVQSGQLILSHSVDTNSTYQGAGTAKIGVVVKNGDEVIRTYDLSTSDITLDDKIIKSDSTYTIDVTLEATATGNDELGTTVLAIPSGQDSTYFSQKSSTTSGKTKTIVLNSFSVASLFSNSTQSVKNIIYHSYFNQSVFNYNLTFQYTDRFDATKNYVRKGQLTSAQVANKEYVSESGGTFSLLPAFIQTVAPYESNFNDNFTWNYSSAVFTHSDSVYTCTATITASSAGTNTRTAIFALPYAHDANGAASGDAVAEATTTNLILDSLTYETVIKATNGDYITAPTQVGSKYFQYWSINTTKTENNTQTKGDEVARCYFKAFNFAAYDNYYIEPVYDTAQYDYKNSGSFTNITYLDTTRNQWNSDGENHYTTSGTKKTASASDRTAAADLLYNDFMLNYNYDGKDIYLAGDDVNNITDIGYIVERVQLLDENQDGTRDTTMSKYADKGMTADEAKTIVATYNTNMGTQNKITKFTGSDSRIARYSVNKTALDNKNRIEIYDAYYNAAGWDKDDQDFVAHYAYRNYVYKVYTYMVVDGVTKVSDNPAYFTMYNEAIKTADKMTAN